MRKSYKLKIGRVNATASSKREAAMAREISGIVVELARRGDMCCLLLVNSADEYSDEYMNTSRRQ